MLFRSRPTKVFYYGKAVDFRKQALRLAALVDAEMPGELMAGHWFVFASIGKKKAKKFSIGGEMGWHFGRFALRATCSSSAVLARQQGARSPGVISVSFLTALISLKTRRIQ